MRSFDLISLFEEPHSATLGVPPFFFSSVVHAIVLGLLSYGLLHGPRIEDPIVTERYSVRRLQLNTPASPQQESSENSSTEDNTTDPALLLPSPLGASGHQTLIQPDFHSHTSFAKPAPVPTVVIWTPELASTRQIVAPLPDKPTATSTKPSLDAPNEELAPADLGVAAAQMPHRPMPLTPGTTSPLSTQVPQLLQMAPATASLSDQQPTPTAVLSLSKLRMTEGTIILPPVNEMEAKVPSQSTTTGLSPSASNGTAKAQHPAGDSKSVGTVHAIGDSSAALLSDSSNSVDHIELPRTGRFGVVVVGASISDEYPESLQVWSNRVAYTVYLHVGLTKSWILEYAQNRPSDAQSSGTVARLEAPWPYDIFRPNLVARDLNADALMVHGIVNEAGRFESLAIAFPAQFARAAFVLHALQQWQFRPARQNGRPVPVEVLLIIPDELN